jgi:hypothetical protein
MLVAVGSALDGHYAGVHTIAGVGFIEEDGEGGPGVRLRKMRGR